MDDSCQANLYMNRTPYRNRLCPQNRLGWKRTKKSSGSLNKNTKSTKKLFKITLVSLKNYLLDSGFKMLLFDTNFELFNCFLMIKFWQYAEHYKNTRPIHANSSDIRKTGKFCILVVIERVPKCVYRGTRGLLDRTARDVIKHAIC